MTGNTGGLIDNWRRPEGDFETLRKVEAKVGLLPTRGRRLAPNIELWLDDEPRISFKRRPVN
jgi:hypothetical protein